MPDNAIWAVTGPEHDARMARELAWIATGGQTGIVGPESLEVVAQPTPNNTVRIMPGGFSIAATSQSAAIGYTSAPWQSYMRAIYEPLTVEIGSTGSSGGRTDVVGIVVDDPEFEGTSPDVDAHQYWRPHVVRNAGNNATRPEHFASLGRPFLPLAQVRIPASTATITNSMIHDIRFLAVSRSETRDLPAIINNRAESIIIPSTQSAWQTIHTVDPIPVPQWATNAKIALNIGPVHTVDGAAHGEFRFAMTRWTAVPTRWVQMSTVGIQGAAPRFYLHSSGNVGLARSTAGGTISMDLQIRRTEGSTRTGRFIVPGSDVNICRLELRVTFEEAPRSGQ